MHQFWVYSAGGTLVAKRHDHIGKSMSRRQTEYRVWSTQQNKTVNTSAGGGIAKKVGGNLIYLRYNFMRKTGILINLKVNLILDKLTSKQQCETNALQRWICQGQDGCSRQYFCKPCWRPWTEIPVKVIKHPVYAVELLLA